MPATSYSSVTAARDHALIIGIGNDGRQDDGLGWAFLDELERLGRPSHDLCYRFQLQIEDAERIRHASHVVFVDACRESIPDGFRWEPCSTAVDLDYTSHRLSPQTVLGLCRRLYDASPQAHLLMIEGRAWELAFGLSPAARDNLDRAVRFFNG